MYTANNKSDSDDSIQPGTPFPEPEVKPQIVPDAPSSSQASVAEKAGTAKDSASGNTPT